MQHLQSLRQKYKSLRLARERLVKAMEAALWRRKDWEDSGPDPSDTTGRRRLWRWQGAPPAGGKVPRPRTQIRKPGTGRASAKQEQPQETTPMSVAPVSVDAEIAAMVQRARQELRQERSQAWRTTQNPLDLTEALQVDALNADGRYDFPLWMFVRVATRDTILAEDDAAGRSLRPALRLLDKYAAGQATDTELQRANGSDFLGPRVAVRAAHSAANRVISARAIHDDAADARVQAEAYYADILRGLIGDPYRPVRLPPINHDMVNLARAAYASQLSDHSLHPTQLDILADALEEAGASVEVIEHLRSPIPHYQGDWVIEAILKDAPAAEAAQHRRRLR